MDVNDLKIQNIDQDSVIRDYFCAYSEKLQEVVAIIVFQEEDFLVFWSDNKLPIGIQLAVLSEARVMFAERLESR